MVMGERIQKLEHPGTLRNFRWPANMLSFGRYNLIYGWQGGEKRPSNKNNPPPTFPNCATLTLSF